MVPPISLTCETVILVDLIVWYKDRTQVGTGLTFEIASFSEGDVGNYSCRASINEVGLLPLQLQSFNWLVEGNIIVCIFCDSEQALDIKDWCGMNRSWDYRQCKSLA